MTPMRSVYPCRYLHELNFYCTSVQRRIAPARSPQQLIECFFIKTSDEDLCFTTQFFFETLYEMYEYFKTSSRAVSGTILQLVLVTLTHRSPLTTIPQAGFLVLGNFTGSHILGWQPSRLVPYPFWCDRSGLLPSCVYFSCVKWI